MLEFRVLGPFQVLLDGTPLGVGRRRERALLVGLVLYPNQVVPLGRLAESTCAEGEPPATVGAMRVYVSRLRALLRESGGPDVLLTHPGGYELRVPAETVDAARFESTATAARQRLAARDPVAARAMLDAALALWRGPALVEHRDAAFARAAAQRLEGARIGALEDRFEAMLGCGEHREIVEALAEFTGGHPLRERAWTLRVLALYRAGRQAEALAVLREVRELLGEELGLEPGRELRGLELAILRQDPALDPPPRTRATRRGEAAATTTAHAGPIGLPARLAVLPEIGFVGRPAELAALDLALEEVDSGTGHRLLLIQGEPGIGKTTLCAQFGRIAHAGGATVLYGRCEEDLGIPYQPFAQALHHYVARVDPALLVDYVTGCGSEVAAIVPALRTRLPGTAAPVAAETEDRRYQLLRGAVGLLAQACADRPLVLIVDDLHWADRPTLLMLRHLIGAAEPMRLLVVATYRGNELVTGVPLVDTLAALRRAGAQRRDLTGLDDAETLALIETAAGHVLDEDLVALGRQLRADTRGNPFFLTHVLRHLADRGLLRREDGRWRSLVTRTALGVPAGLREVIAERVARLGPRAEQVLTRAAVIGQEFEVALLAAAGRAEQPEVIEELERVVRAGLVTDLAPGRYAFAHATVQEALYETLNPTRRALMHRQVAECLGELVDPGPGPRAAELAHHWLASAPDPGDPRPVEHARWAAQAALAARAPEEAARWYSAAVDLRASRPPQLSDIELAIELGNAQRLAGDIAHRQTLLAAGELAARLGNPDLMVRATLANNRGTYASPGFTDAEQVAALEAALAVSPEPSKQRALLQASLAMELANDGDWPTRSRLAAETMELARGLDDPDTLVRVHNLLYLAISVPGTLTDRLATTAEYVQLAQTSPDPIRHWARRLRFHACAEAGDLTGWKRHLPQLMATAETAGDPAMIWFALFNLQGRALLAGRLEESEQLADRALAVGSSCGMADAQWAHTAAIAAGRMLQGRAREAVPAYRAVLANAPLGLFRAGLARLLSATGSRDEARALLRSDAETGFTAIPYSYYFLYGMAAYAEVAARVGDLDAAATIYDHLAPWHDQFAFLWFDHGGSVSLQLGMLATALGRFDAAESHLAGALAMHQRMAAPAFIARTHLETVRLLQARRATGDEESARRLLDIAAELAETHGFVALVREAGELAGQSDSEPDSAEPMRTDPAPATT